MSFLAFIYTFICMSFQYCILFFCHSVKSKCLFILLQLFQKCRVLFLSLLYFLSLTLSFFLSVTFFSFFSLSLFPIPAVSTLFFWLCHEDRIWEKIFGSNWIKFKPKNNQTNVSNKGCFNQNFTHIINHSPHCNNETSEQTNLLQVVSQFIENS